MDRINELNKKLGDKVVPYRKLARSKVSIVNENLWHFLAIGLAYTVVSGAIGINSNSTTEVINTYPLVSLLLSIVSVVVLLGLVSWIINLYRAVIEKTANKGITLTKSSFIPDFNGNFFKRGGKYLVSTFLYGLVVGLVLIIPIMLITLLIVGVLGGVFLGASSPEELIGVSMIGGFLGIIAGFILYLLITILIAILISPFLLPIATLYMYYGDEIGIWEAVTLSFKLGKQNYGLLLKTSLKVTGLNILGMLLFGVGVVYTSVIGILIEVDAVSSILGISLAEGKTFKEEPELKTPTYETEVNTVNVENQEPEEEEYVATEVPKEEQIRETVVIYEEYEDEEPLNLEDDGDIDNGQDEGGYIDISETLEEIEEVEDTEDE